MDIDYLIEGRGVSKVFKDFWGRPKVHAVNAVDIAVRRGTIFGLLGPNGAGKSTLMKLLLGHLYPTGGTLSVMGKHPSNVDAKVRIGYMPEKTTLYRHLTPVQTLKFFGQILVLPSDVIRKRSEQLLEIVGLSHAKNHIVGEFSHGMGRRMGLAHPLPECEACQSQPGCIATATTCEITGGHRLLCEDCCRQLQLPIKASCTLNVKGTSQAVPCDLMEWNDEEPIDCSNGVPLAFTPFEIKTFKLK